MDRAHSVVKPRRMRCTSGRAQQWESWSSSAGTVAPDDSFHSRLRSRLNQRLCRPHPVPFATDAAGCSASQHARLGLSSSPRGACTRCVPHGVVSGHPVILPFCPAAERKNNPRDWGARALSLRSHLSSLRMTSYVDVARGRRRRAATGGARPGRDAHGHQRAPSTRGSATGAYAGVRDKQRGGAAAGVE